ncbi:MAG TPA: tRNA (guanosine(37)-N1)-methyltransferase TrmD [Terriglobia bacterium]|nr:tRNA (guanosine(37)-N1)-methyltransferase TrmD [Terriglobia bacterium]
MIFDIITIFPDFFSSILAHGILKRAIDGSQISVRVRNLRDFTDDLHRSVDDRPFGGGPGMVFKPEPIFRAVEAIQAEAPVKRLRVILLTPQGRLLNQRIVQELSREPRLVLVCGRYGGVDERVATHIATDEISIGDYILSGGEVAAAVLLEATARLLPGVLGNEESKELESFTISGTALNSTGDVGLLGFPQYTRPADFRGLKVPEVLLSGNHQQIREWRERQALLKTCRKRPDLLGKAGMDSEELRRALKRAAEEETIETIS